MFQDFLGPAFQARVSGLMIHLQAELAEAPDARREASIGLYTQSLLSSEALRVGWGLIINIL